MAELKRITTEYLALEDRVRLTGEVREGKLVVLWLTQRLLQRLLPVLLRWLEPQGADSLRAEMVFNFAQQAGHTEPMMPGLTRQTDTPEPVNLAPLQPLADSISIVVESVDVEQSDEAIRLLFKSESGNLAEFGFKAHSLRLWLGILHRAYCHAQWPLDAWPTWLREGAATPEKIRGMLH